LAAFSLGGLAFLPLAGLEGSCLFLLAPLARTLEEIKVPQGSLASLEVKIFRVVQIAEVNFFTLLDVSGGNYLDGGVVVRKCRNHVRRAGVIEAVVQGIQSRAFTVRERST